MPLFTEETAKSNELPAAIQLADRLADNPAVQDLAEKTTATETLTHIVVGIARDPFDGDTYTLAELESRHFVAHIYAEATEGYVAGLGREAMGNPREGGQLRVYLCRQIRESEDILDAYNFFWDRISAIATPLIISAEQELNEPRNYRFKLLERILGPMQTELRSEGAQGKRLEAMLRVNWGDIETE
jgi:hypothetical protein